MKPKLEFFKIKLKHKKEAGKTFRDFAIDELGASESSNDSEILKVCFTHFIKSLELDIAKDEHHKKKLTIVEDQEYNKHLDKRPAFDSNESIIYGVINGGPYGRDRIVTDIGDPEHISALGKSKSVLMYYFFLMYLPADYNEGCFIIHSNSKEENITTLFRSYIKNLFKGKTYNQALIEPFSPKSFQNEFRNGAVLKSMTFKTTFVEPTYSGNGISDILHEYDIKIQATPKKNVAIENAKKVKDYLSKKMFGSESDKKQLGKFAQTRIETQNIDTRTKKSFEWNTKDNEFVPVVYLEGRCSKFNSDGTPDFNELQDKCKEIFKNEVLSEIRPDLDVRKVR